MEKLILSEVLNCRQKMSYTVSDCDNSTNIYEGVASVFQLFCECICQLCPILAIFLAFPYLSKVSCFVAFIATLDLFPPFQHSEIILFIDRRPPAPTCDRRWKAVDWWNPPNPPPATPGRGQDPPDPTTRGSAQSLPS